MRKILFRADGNVQIGLGHVIRTLALAEMLREKFYCIFLIQEPSASLVSQISAVCNEVISLPVPANETELRCELDPYLQDSEIVVLDGYKFDTIYQRRVRSSGCTLVSIDDIHACHFISDAIINHGIADASLYSREFYTRILAGPQYSLLRGPFLKYLENGGRPVTGGEKNIFLCFGGADINNLTLKYLKLLIDINSWDTINVVIGGAFLHREKLQSFVNENGQRTINVHSDINGEQMLELIRHCTLAIVPGSTVAIECASVGIGMICGYYVDNQHDIVAMLKENDLALTVGDFETLHVNNFARLVETMLEAGTDQNWHKSRRLFDRFTRKRFIDLFENLSMQHDLVIREAVIGDAELLLEWANDPVVRLNSVNKDPIVFENHLKWLERRLAADTTQLYICTLNGNPVGQVRFDIETGVHSIGYSVAGEMRGKGIAYPLLCKAMEKQIAVFGSDITFSAIVKKGNAASEKVFHKLHFDLTGLTQIKEETYLTFKKQIKQITAGPVISHAG